MSGEASTSKLQQFIIMPAYIKCENKVRLKLKVRLEDCLTALGVTFEVGGVKSAFFGKNSTFT